MLINSILLFVFAKFLFFPFCSAPFVYHFDAFLLLLLCDPETHW